MTTLTLVRTHPNGTWHLQDEESCGWSSRDPIGSSVEVRAGSKIAATLIAEIVTGTLCKACFRYRSRVTPAVAKEVADYTGAKMPGMFFVLQPNPTVREMFDLARILDLSEDEVWAKYLDWRKVSLSINQILGG